MAPYCPIFKEKKSAHQKLPFRQFSMKTLRFFVNFKAFLEEFEALSFSIQ